MGSTDHHSSVEDARAEREAKVEEGGRSKERECSTPEGEEPFGVGKGDEDRHLGEW